MTALLLFGESMSKSKIIVSLAWIIFIVTTVQIGITASTWQYWALLLSFGALDLASWRDGWNRAERLYSKPSE